MFNVYLIYLVLPARVAVGLVWLVFHSHVVCLVAYNVPICWHGVDFLCMLLFCIVFIYGVKHRILEIE
jgi:hypothetical protein